MPSPTAPTVRTLGVADRPKRKVPRWPFFVLGAALLTQLVAILAPSLTAIAAVGSVLYLAALVAGFSLGSWAEERIFQALHGGPVLPRMLLTLAMPIFGMIVPAVFFAVLSATKVTQLLPAIGTFTGGFTFWFATSATGSAFVVLIDVAVSSVVRSFKARVLAAVLCLLAASYLATLFLGMLALALYKAMRDQPETFVTSKIDLGPAFAWLEPSLPTGDQIIAAMKNEPSLILFGLFGMALFGFPAVLSACGKLAEAVMERIHPLALAFEHLARGDRSIRVEEAGSSDFIELSRKFNSMVESLTLAERMERAFGVYVSGHVLERIRAQHGEAQLPPSLRDATVFFADIRGFTSFSERLSPEQVVSMLNRYFDRVVAIVDEHQGYLNKFIGDAVVVVFNGPMEQPDHAARAVRCAVALQREVARLNSEGAFAEVGALNVGVGISTGPMVCGNVGSSRQMEYTVIGDTVNLASRLTSQAGPGEVWVSERTAETLPEPDRGEELPPVKVKGKELPVKPRRVWPLISPPDATTRKLPAQG